MRFTRVLALLGLSFSAVAQVPFVEILGTAIQRGMTQEEVRELIPSSAIHVVPKGPDAPEEIVIWIISPWEQGGTIRFDNGQVVRATRNWRTSNELETYEMFVLLQEVLTRLTAGSDYTCAATMTYAPQDIFPQSITVLSLPDKIIEIGTASRGEGSTGVFIRESLRMNPVPAAAKTQAELGEARHCVFME